MPVAYFCCAALALALVTWLLGELLIKELQDEGPVRLVGPPDIASAINLPNSGIATIENPLAIGGQDRSSQAVSQQVTGETSTTAALPSPAAGSTGEESSRNLSADDATAQSTSPNLSVDGSTTQAQPGAALQADGATRLALPTQSPTYSETILRPSLEGFTPESLRPAEIAYLCRRGDMSHALIVLGADILQRAIKSQISEKPMPQQAPYEQKAWAMARDQVSDWAKRKVGDALPPDVRHDPVGFVKGMSKIYTFLAVSVRKFVARTLEDPRQIRQYISFAGVARLLLNLSTAGYQEGLENGLRQELHRRGLLVSSERRAYYSKLMFLLAGTVGCASFVLTLHYIQPLALAIAAWLSATLIALSVQATFFVREQIPLYMELKELASAIGRGGFRLGILRLALTVVTAVCRLSTVVVFLVLALVVFLIEHFALKAPPEVMQMTVVLSGCQLASIMAFLASGRIAHEARPTKAALAEIQKVRKKVEQVPTMEAIKSVLLSPDYDATFCEMLALYGVESLLIIL